MPKKNEVPEMSELDLEALEGATATRDGVRACIMQYAQVSEQEAELAIKLNEEEMARGISLASYNYFVAGEIVRAMGAATDE